MTLDEAIKSAKPQASRLGQTLFIVRASRDADDTDSYHFGCKAAMRTLLSQTIPVATVHPDGRIVDLEVAA